MFTGYWLITQLSIFGDNGDPELKINNFILYYISPKTPEQEITKY